MKIVCFGPGPLFKGGISNYNTSLVKALHDIPGIEVEVVSWTSQYPAIVPREFIDKSSKEKFLDDTIPVTYVTNYNNPFTWSETARKIIQANPDKIIFQWYNAQQGLPLSFIVKKIKKALPSTEIIFDLHFVIPKENSKIDRFFTRMGLKHPHTFIVHAKKTLDELKALFPEEKFVETFDGQRDWHKNSRPVLRLYHPVYDIFKPIENFDKEKVKQELGLRPYVFLFFGFIRKYKGLHNCIEAFKILTERRRDVSLLICGESFWNTLDDRKWNVKFKKWLFSIAKKLFLKKEDDENDYRPLELIEKYGLQSFVRVENRFIANEEVPKFFQVSDAVLLFYETATPSGVESLSYNFSLPVLATKVGHFPETIIEGKNGYLAEPGNFKQMADIMEKIITHPIDRTNIDQMAKKFSWQNYAKAIINDGH